VIKNSLAFDPIDYVWAAIAVMLAGAILVCTFVFGKGVIVGSGLAFFFVYLVIRVQTGQWIDQVPGLGQYRPYAETDPRALRQR